MRLGGIKQKKSAWGLAVNYTNCLLFYSPKTRSQVWILIYRNCYILTFVSGFTNCPFPDVYFSNSKMASSSWVIIRIHVTTPLPYRNFLLQTPYFSCAEPNWISSTLERHWRDIWFKFDKSSTLSNLTLLPHQTKTAVPNWFRHTVLNSSVRFGTWLERRLNRTLDGYGVFTPRRSNFR